MNAYGLAFIQHLHVARWEWNIAVDGTAELRDTRHSRVERSGATHGTSGHQQWVTNLLHSERPRCEQLEEETVYLQSQRRMR